MAPKFSRLPSNSEIAEAKRLKKTPSETEASKKARDNFKGYNEEQIYIEKVDGSSIFDKLIAGVRQKREDPKWPMGLFFYASIKARHRRGMSKLEAPMPKESIRQALVKAMVSSDSNHHRK